MIFDDSLTDKSFKAYQDRYVGVGPYSAVDSAMDF